MRQTHNNFYLYFRIFSQSLSTSLPSLVSNYFSIMDKHIFKLFDLTFDNNNIFKWKFIMMQREKMCWQFNAFPIANEKETQQLNKLLTFFRAIFDYTTQKCVPQLIQQKQKMLASFCFGIDHVSSQCTGWPSAKCWFFYSIMFAQSISII